LPAHNHFDLTRAVLDGDGGATRAVLDRGGLDTEGLTAWLRRHQLALPFSAGLTHGPLAGEFPEIFVRNLAERARAQAEHNGRVLAATAQGIRTLNECGIPTILLKGVHYAESFWGGLDRRSLWDVDLLVPSDAFEPALDCLLARGYVRRPGGGWGNAAVRRLSHAVTLQQQGIELDLHWGLRYRPAFRIDYAALWGSRQPFSIGDERFEVPSDEYSLLMLLLGIGHDLEAGHLKLKQFFDLHLLLTSLHPSFDWRAFFTARERERLDRLSINVLMLHRVLFGGVPGFTGLNPALDERRALAQAYDDEKAWRLVDASRQSLYNRRWYASLYPDGALAYGVWWALTAPLRFALGRRL